MKRRKWMLLLQMAAVLALATGLAAPVQAAEVDTARGTSLTIAFAEDDAADVQKTRRAGGKAGDHRPFGQLARRVDLGQVLLGRFGDVGEQKRGHASVVVHLHLNSIKLSGKVKRL